MSWLNGGTIQMLLERKRNENKIKKNLAKKSFMIEEEFRKNL